MKAPSIWAHLRDIILLPGTVAGLIPYLVCNSNSTIIPHLMAVRIAGVLIFLPGFLLFSYTVFLFRIKGMGTLAPWSPPQKLVISGPYLYCRNPMITGVVGMLTGEGLFFWSAGILLWGVLVVIINTAYFHFSEEPGLVKRFGEDYIRYRQNVPMWVPKFTPYKRGE